MTATETDDAGTVFEADCELVYDSAVVPESDTGIIVFVQGIKLPVWYGRTVTQEGEK